MPEVIDIAKARRCQNGECSVADLLEELDEHSGDFEQMIVVAATPVKEDGSRGIYINSTDCLSTERMGLLMWGILRTYLGSPLEESDGL